MTLRVGDLIFPDMHIVANSDLNTSYNLILSATMFNGLIYEIDTYYHKLNITVLNDSDLVRNLRVVNKDGKIHVLYNAGEPD